jgi:hypothetical protein
MRNGIGNVVNRTMKRNNNKETAPAPEASNASSATSPRESSATAPQQPPSKQQQAPDNGKNGARKSKPTHEEATLTAKNYRLAKELVCYATLFDVRFVACCDLSHLESNVNYCRERFLLESFG